MECELPMVYCPRCGKQNPEGSIFCNSCGASLASGQRVDKECDDRCEEECSGRSKIGVIFWGTIIILIGLWFIFEFVIKKISGLPDWVYSFEWGWIFALVIGVAILVAGINIIIKGSRRQ